MRRQRIEEENWGGKEEAVNLGSRAAPPRVACFTLSFKVSIYCRLGRGWRLFLGNSVIKPCQTVQMLKASGRWWSRGRKFSWVKFMRLNTKLKQSLANPHGKMIHLPRVGKSIFITFIQPAPRFYSLTERLLFPSWCCINHGVSGIWNLPLGGPQRGWFCSPQRRRLFCTGGFWAKWRSNQRLHPSAACLLLRNSAWGCVPLCSPDRV